MTQCVFCGSLLPENAGRGRSRLYCDSTCKNKAENARNRARRADTYKLLPFSRMRTCLLCGRLFQVAKTSQQLCSTSCRQALLRREDRTCAHCGKSFYPKATDRITYCSRACAFAAKAAQPKLIPSKPSKPLTPPALCKVCGGECPPPRSVYCSDDCRKASARRDQRRYGEAKHDRGEKQCKECGVVFHPAYGEKRRTFCSQQCSRSFLRRVAKATRRARKRALPYEHVDPIAVFERDSWRCQICGGDAPRELRGTLVDLAPELDHIVPLAAGGKHVWDNLGLAHRRCNREKGAKVTYERS